MGRRRQRRSWCSGWWLVPGLVLGCGFWIVAVLALL